MPGRPLPCHPEAEAKHLRDLGHHMQFDFDLYRCALCDKSWIWAWSDYGSDWEAVTEDEAAKMLATSDSELRPLMKSWGKDF